MGATFGVVDHPHLSARLYNEESVQWAPLSWSIPCIKGRPGFQWGTETFVNFLQGDCKDFVGVLRWWASAYVIDKILC